MTKLACAVMTIASLAIGLSDAAFAASFDGQWNLAVTAKQSPGCGAATYPYTIAIKGETVTGISGPSRLSTLSATVNAGGNIKGVIAAKGARSTMSGRLKKTGSGSGVWSSQDWGCSGTWTARKTS